MKNGKPTTDDVLALEQKLTNFYGTTVDKFEKDEVDYELNFKDSLGLPTEFASQGVVLPTARDFVDTFVDHIDIANARVYSNRKAVYAKSELEAEAFRKFGLGMLHMTNLATDISQWRVSAKHYALHGLAVIGTFWDADLWPDKPEKKDGESEDSYAEKIDAWREETHLSLPIVLKSIHPHNVLMDPSNPRQFIIEKSTMLRLDAEKLYPWWKNPEDKEITEEVEKIEYWDKDFHCVLVDREPILRVKGGVDHHRYGFIPYVVIESGLGNLSFENRPEMRYVGILRYIHDLLISESRDYSVSDIILSKTAWGGGFLQNKGNAEVAVKIVDQGNFGTWQQLPPGIEPVTVTPQVPPEALNTHLSRTSYYLQAHAAPSSLRGMGEEGVRSGADRRLVISQAMARYQYANEAFAAGAARVIINCAKLFKNVIPGDMRIWARTPTDEFDMLIDKKELKEPFTCYVEFAPVNEDDEYKRHMDLEQLVAAGIVTPNWARQQMTNVDPKAVALDIEKEKLENDPAIQQMISGYAQAELAKAIQAKMAADQIKESGVPPAPVAPEMAGAMPPMPGQEAGIPPAPPLEVGGRIIPPIREITQPGSLPAIQNQQAGMMPPMPQMPRPGQQGMGGGGNTP
jgi:hypothetical protein